MTFFNDEQRQRIAAALTKANAVLPCPRCGNAQFSIVPGCFAQPIQTERSGGLELGGPVLPSVVVICTRCGYMAQHALGTLNLLDIADKSKEGADQSKEGADQPKEGVAK